jgi:HEAT repeat protein
LAQVLENDPSYKLRKEAAYTLRYYPNERTIKVLEAALNDSRSNVRANAVDSLASIRSSSSVKPLLDLLDSERYSTKMKKKIVWALGRFSRDERVRKVLQSIAEDDQEHTEIVREARWSLSQLDDL